MDAFILMHASFICHNVHEEPVSGCRNNNKKSTRVSCFYRNFILFIHLS